jgi:hypothetical protein
MPRNFKMMKNIHSNSYVCCKVPSGTYRLYLRSSKFRYWFWPEQVFTHTAFRNILYNGSIFLYQDWMYTIYGIRQSCVFLKSSILHLLLNYICYILAVVVFQFHWVAQIDSSVLFVTCVSVRTKLMGHKICKGYTIYIYIPCKTCYPLYPIILKALLVWAMLTSDCHNSCRCVWSHSVFVTGFEILSVVTLKHAIFRDIMLCLVKLCFDCKSYECRGIICYLV